MALTKVTGDFIKAGSITQGHLHSSHGITTSHITEGDKLFFTNARVDSRVGSLSTSNLSEGTNLYYTNARARAAISATGSLSYNSTTGVMSFTMPAQNTSNITEGSNLYYTDARADARIAAADTGDLSEGSNLYYTNARARGAISVSGNALSYNSSTGVITSNFEESPTFSGNVVINGSTSSGNAFYVTRGSDGAVAFRITNTGEVVTQANYFYASASGVSMYVQNTAVFRGSILNDGSNAPVRIADDLTIDDDLTVTGGDITLGGTGRIQGIDTVSANTDAANKLYVDNQVAGIVASAPSTLDTLNELAAALGDDSNFSTTVTNSIATKLPLAGGALTGTLTCNNAASDKKIAFRRTGGNSFSIEHDSAFIYFYNETTSSVVFKMANNNNTTFTGTITASGYNDSNWNTAYTYSQVGHLPLSGGTLSGFIQLGANQLRFDQSGTRSWTVSAAGGNLNINSGDSVGNVAISSGLTVADNTAFSGDITINSSGLATSPLIRLNNSESSSYNHAIEAINANLTAGESEIIVIGKETNTKNAGYIGYNWAADASNNNYVTIGQWGENHIFRVYGDVVTSQVSFRGSSDVRGTIFYDIDNTGYYLNPASTSNVNAINAVGQFATTLANGFRVDSASYARIELDSNDNWSYIRYQDNGTVSWDVAVYNGGQYELRPGGSGTNAWTYTAAGNAQAGASSRAPIFYDSNDTNHYLDPASTSVVNTLRFSGSSNNGRFDADEWGVRFKTDAGYILFGPANTSHAHIYTDRPNFYFNQQIQLNGGSLINTNDIRAKIFYDVDDTGYYVNPATGSNLYAPITFQTNDSTLTFQDAGTNAFQMKMGAGDELYLGSNNNYQLQMTTSGNVNTQGDWRFGANFVKVGNSSTYNSDDGSWGSRFVVSSTVHARIDVAQDANAVRASWFTHTGHLYSTFGTVTGHHLRLISHNATRQYLYNGYSEESGSYRAPIFYDSNDTGFYLNPASQSRLGSLKLDGIISGTTSGCAEYGRNHAYHTPEIKGYGAEFMIGAQNTEININYRTCNNGASGHTPTTWKWRAGSASNWSDHYMGLIQSSSSMRAPEFIDSNDTNYYIDPASTTLSGKLRSYLLFNDHGAGVVGSYSASKYQLVFAMGNSYKGALDGTNVTSGYGLWYSHPNAGGVAANLNSHGLMNIENGSWMASLSGSTRAAYDMRAPIFYDLGNTGYYVNPDSTSNVNAMNFAGVADFNGGHGGVNITNTSILSSASSSWTGDPGGAGKIQYHANRWYIVSDSSSNMIVQFRRNGSDVSYIDNAGRLIGAPDTRAPIFYDSDNTGYYVDPASTSKFNDIWTTDGGNNGTAPRWDTSFYVAQSQHYYGHSSTQTMYLGESNTINIRSIGIASGSFRAPIFYDSGNTGYYLDAGSTSNLNAATFVGTVSGQNAYFAQSVGIGFTSGNIGGRLNVKNSAAGQIAGKFQLGGSVNSSSTGVFVNTTASYASSGMFLHFQSNHISGDDNVLIAYLDGDIVNKNNSYTQYSDQRLKENIVDATSKLEEIKQIRVRNFNFIGEDLKQIGVVAQELEPIFPGLVKEREVPGHEDPIKTVKYSVLVPILIKAMQEQQTIIDDLKSRLETLENN